MSSNPHENICKNCGHIGLIKKRHSFFKDCDIGTCPQCQYEETFWDVMRYVDNDKKENT